MWELIGKRTEYGTTVIWTSHYIEEIERSCGRAMIMDCDRLIGDQRPGTLIAEFGTASVRIQMPDPADRARLLQLVPARCVTASRGQPPTSTRCRRRTRTRLFKHPGCLEAN